MHPDRLRPGWLRRLALPVLFSLVAVAGLAGPAAAQEDPFVTNGPEQLGERVSESEQATRRLNLAVAGLLGLAGVIGVSSVVFWRLSAPQVATAGEVQPAFHIQFTPTDDAPAPSAVAPVAVPPVAAATVDRTAVADPVAPSAPPARPVLAPPSPLGPPAVARAATPFPDAATGPSVSIEDVSPAAASGQGGTGTWASQGWGSDGHE